MRSLALKLAPGQDLRQSLQLLARSQNVSGYVLSVVGNLSRAAFQCPGRAEPNVLEGDLEIITLQGHFSPEGVHLHLSLSDGACQVWGGHLEPGTLVNKGADLLVGLLDQPLPQEPLNLEALVASTVPSQGQSGVEATHAPRVEVAVLPGCPWCTRALRILRSLDIAHTVVTCDTDATYQALHERSAMTTFPQVFIDGAVIGGYDALAQLHADGALAQLR